MAARGKEKAPISRFVRSTHSTSLGSQQRQESQSQRSASFIPGSLRFQSNHSTSSGPSHLQRTQPTTGMRDVEVQTDSANTQEGGNSHSESEEPTTHVSSAASTAAPPLWVEDGHFMPADLSATHAISRLIKTKYEGFWPTWKDVPQYNKDRWWDEFQSNFSIPPHYLGALRKKFNSKVSNRLSDYLKEAREKFYADEVKPEWIKDKVWAKLLEYWNGEYFQKISQVNKANRNRISEDGRPVAKHTGGSISAHDTRTKMEKRLKRPVSMWEVWNQTHTSKKTNLLVDSLAVAVQEALSSKLPEIVPLLGQEDAELPPDVTKQVDKTLIECLGANKRGRISGLGNLSQECSIGSSARTSLPLSSQQVEELTQKLSHLTEENQGLHGEIEVLRERQADQDAEMKRKLEEQAKIIEETKARAIDIEQRALARAAAMDAEFARMRAHFSKMDPTFTSSGAESEAS